MNTTSEKTTQKTPPQVLITGGSIVIAQEGKTKIFLSSDPRFTTIKRHIFDENWDGINQEIDLSERAHALGGTIENDVLIRDGVAAHDTLQKKLINYSRDILEAFNQKLEENPSKNSANELLDFLKHNSLPLTPKGTFLAWKSVRADFKDHHTGRVDNSPGATPSMDREICDPDRNNACSTGYHVGDLTYAKNFQSGRLMIAEVDPQHVTSVPYDHDHKKLRCHKYEILCEMDAEISSDEEAIDFIESLAKNTALLTKLRNDAKKLKAAVQEEINKDKEISKHVDSLLEEKLSPKKDKEEKPYTKIEILNYIFNQKANKKGNGYINKMIQSKFPKQKINGEDFPSGVQIIKEMISNPKNPSRLNKATKALLENIITA